MMVLDSKVNNTIFYHQAFKFWLEKSLKNLPSDATLATATHEQILQFLSDVLA